MYGEGSYLSLGDEQEEKQLDKFRIRCFSENRSILAQKMNKIRRVVNDQAVNKYQVHLKPGGPGAAGICTSESRIKKTVNRE